MAKDSLEHGPVTEQVPGEDYYTAIGDTLTQWSMLEQALANLFTMTVAGKHHNQAAYQAFWAIVSFDGKLKMTNAAVQVQASSNEALLEKWEKLYKFLRKRAIKRNAIAHGTLMGFTTAEGTEVLHAPYYWARIDRNIAKGRHWPPESAMTITDIRKESVAYRDASRRISEITTAILEAHG